MYLYMRYEVTEIEIICSFAWIDCECYPMCKRTLNGNSLCHWLNAKSPFQQVALFKWYNVGIGKRGWTYLFHIQNDTNNIVRHCWYVRHRPSTIDTIHIILFDYYCLNMKIRTFIKYERTKRLWGVFSPFWLESLQKKKNSRNRRNRFNIV